MDYSTHIPGFILDHLKITKPLVQTNIQHPLKVHEDKYRMSHNHVTKLAGNSTDDNIIMTPYDPVSLMSKDTANILKSGDFGRITPLLASKKNDLNDVYQNLNDPSRWVEVSPGGEKFYLTYGPNGTVWSWARELSSEEMKSHPHKAFFTDPSKKAYHVQIGSYSQSTTWLGLSSFTLSNFGAIITSALVSFVAARILGPLLAQGIELVVMRIGIYFLEALAEAGVAAAGFTIPTTLISIAASCIIAFVVFVGILYFLNWLLKKYALIIDVYNWDPNNTWVNLPKDYEDNASVSSPGYMQKTIIPWTPPSGGITPPGFQPIPNTQGVVGYMTLIYENESVWLGGLDMAVGFTPQNDLQNGFLLKYSLPRFGDNSYNANNFSGTATPDLATYFKNGQWGSGKITLSSHGQDVTVTNDYLSNAPDNAYHVMINIGTPK